MLFFGKFFKSLSLTFAKNCKSSSTIITRDDAALHESFRCTMGQRSFKKGHECVYVCIHMCMQCSILNIEVFAIVSLKIDT